MDLIIRVKEIIGYCPVYKVGDTIVLKKDIKLTLKSPVLSVCILWPQLCPTI